MNKTSIPLGVPAAALVLIGCIVGIVSQSEAPPVSPPPPSSNPTPAVPTPKTPTPVCPGPNCPNPPPKPNTPKPRSPHRPWLTEQSWPVRSASRVSYSSVTPVFQGFQQDGPIHDGHEVAVDLPADILKHNIESKGKGCCVFRSFNYAGLAQNIPELIDLPERMRDSGIAGGGWPEKADAILAKFAPGVKYIQIENGDWSLVKLGLKTGRLPAITYGSNHMVNIACLDEGVGCFRDSNHVGPADLIWGSESEIMARAGGKRFWAVIFLKPRMPAPPKNQSRAAIGDELCAAFIAPALPAPGEWRVITPYREWSLWCAGQQRGNFSLEQDAYVELRNGSWGRAWRRPPVKVPEEATAMLDSRVPNGVCAEQSPTLRAGQERYCFCGRTITRSEAEAALIDDSGFCSLTVIGSEADRKRVLADLDAPDFADFKARVLVQDYAPDNWAVLTERYGFVTTGTPTIYLQAPDGTELCRADSYEGQQTLEAVRIKHPDYQPNPNTPVPTIPANSATAGGGFAALVLMITGAAFGLSLALSEPTEIEGGTA